MVKGSEMEYRLTIECLGGKTKTVIFHSNKQTLLFAIKDYIAKHGDELYIGSMPSANAHTLSHGKGDKA
jgi:hypothetical protein